jgi:DNA-directed RNA polymerase subunit RPC12/RpoP
VYSRCPGQDGRSLTVEVYQCPKCGGEVEIFSDETRAKCQKCGERVCRDRAPSCVEWCPSARQCLGDERWQQL